MHVATHPARPVTTHQICINCPPDSYAGAHPKDVDVYLLGRVRPHVEMTARRLSWQLELSRLTGRA